MLLIPLSGCASAGCVFTQTVRRHHLMALISVSFKSILYSLPSFYLFFLINYQSLPPLKYWSLSFGSWDQTAGPIVVLMGINWGAVEAKVRQNHNTGAPSLGKYVHDYGHTCVKLCPTYYQKRNVLSCVLKPDFICIHLTRVQHGYFWKISTRVTECNSFHNPTPKETITLLIGKSDLDSFYYSFYLHAISCVVRSVSVHHAVYF